MTVGHGWTIYENQVESDYWWWYIATDMADAAISDNEIFYQYATFVDQSATYPEDPFTIGCAITKGIADTYNIQVFTHTLDPDTTGNLASTADPSVVGQTWEGQNTSEMEILSETTWSAGAEHAGSNTAPESADAPLNTNFVCYFAREYAKLGRNPNDFNKDFQVTIGARIYADSTVTTFDAIPSPAAFTVTLSEPAEFQTKTAGAFSLFATGMAAIAMIFALAF